MARHGGLPANIIKRYGVTKKAWAVYRHGGGRRRNPARRRAHTTHRRRRSSRRRNPTGFPFSGARYRPNYKYSSGAYRDRRPKARIPRIVHHMRSRRGRSSTKHRKGRRGRKNPAYGFGGSHGRSMGNIRNVVPLARSSDFRTIWNHKLGSLLVGGGGYLIGGIMASSGGGIAVLVEGFGVAILLRYVLKNKAGGKYAYIAPAYALGSVLAYISNVLSTGSLTGSARLGDTMANLQALASQVKVFGVPALQSWSLKGLTGSTSVEGLGALLKLPGLKGLGVGADLRKLSPSHLTGLGDTSPQGWTYSA
jgi:hypothetical protein